MPRSIRDDDQPGLWPLPETPAGPTANPPIRQHAASVAKTKRRNPTRPVDSSPTIDPEALWTIDDLASYLGIPKHTIYGWRTTNYGPPAIKVGKHLRWRPEGVVAWAKKQELSDE